MFRLNDGGETGYIYNTAENVHKEEVPAYGNCQPYLVIEEQPVAKFRFRYATEMTGPHGCLTGRSSKIINQKTYPRVKLYNYDRSDAIIRCSLFTTDAQNPHPHTLIATVDNQQKEEPHDIRVHARNDYTAEFAGLGILHAPRNKICNKLYKKILAIYTEKFRRSPIFQTSDEKKKSDGYERLKEEVRRRAEFEAKSIDKNQVALLFEAFRLNEKKIMEPICKAVVSDPIQNQKSPKTNDLRICKIDKTDGFCTGGDELYILVEKVSKHDIQVRFFEADWEAYAEFKQTDVHHQFAIVCRTPQYRCKDISSDVTVQVQLYRPSDKAVSSPLKFTYKPLPFNRKRVWSDHCNNQSSVESGYNKRQRITFETGAERENPMNNLILTLTEADVSDFFNDVCGGNSLEGMPNDLELISALETTFGTGYDFPSQHIAVDGPSERRRRSETNKDSPTCSPRTPQQQERQGAKSAPEDRSVEDMSSRLSLVKVEEPAKEGSDGSRQSVQRDDTMRTSLANKLALKRITDTVKKTELFRWAADDSAESLEQLLAFLVDVNAKDDRESTALHWAVRCNSHASMHVLLQQRDIQLDEIDADGRTPLHIAVDQTDIEAAQKLINAGADVTIRKVKTGDTNLHTAVKMRDYPMIKLLIDTGKFTLEEENYNKDTVARMVVDSEDPEVYGLFDSSPLNEKIYSLISDDTSPAYESEQIDESDESDYDDSEEDDKTVTDNYALESGYQALRL